MHKPFNQSIKNSLIIPSMESALIAMTGLSEFQVGGLP